MSNDQTEKFLDRRSLLTGMGAAAAGIAFANQAVGDDKNPATQIGDRTSSIRITGLKTYWVGPVVYVKIETNHGISGWGDLKGVDPRPATSDAIGAAPLRSRVAMRSTV
jgi:hypothetical protein